MPKEKAEKPLCMSGLRHAEYYGMQEVFDGLYAKSSKNETFTNLMNIILKRENILLAYRNIKSNDHIEVYHAESRTALPTSASIFTTTASVPLMCRIAGRSRKPTLSWKQEKA